MRRLRVALAQINTTVGDLEGNAPASSSTSSRARELGADVVAFPELALTGYPPEDLLLRRSFIAATTSSALARRWSTACRGITAVVGFVDCDDDIYNAAAVIHDGELAGVYHKQFLPNYGVFDEKRYFRAGDARPGLRDRRRPRRREHLRGHLVSRRARRRPRRWPAPTSSSTSTARPTTAASAHVRERMLATRAADNAVIVCYVNLVGGQDELVFDGDSIVFDAARRAASRAAPPFEEDLLVVDLDLESRLPGPPARARCAASERLTLRTTRRRRRSSSRSASRASATPAAGAVIDAPLATTRRRSTRRWSLGTRDYVHKNGFETVLVGVSGGIDSSLVAAIAVDALGPEHVVGVSNALALLLRGHPSPTRKQLAENLGIRFMIIPIEPGHAAYLDMLADAFAGTQPGTAEENIQARIRGNIWMALSNKFGWQPVLTCGNKSEMATGYATLYGDMAGGFAVIKDVPKTLVYRLARYRNAGRRPRRHPAGRHRQAAVRRAAPGPAGHRHAAALRGPRPDPRGLRRGGPQRRGDRRDGLRRGTSCGASSAWSTATSTSAARRRPASRSRPAPSAATAACRSPTATGGTEPWRNDRHHRWVAWPCCWRVRLRCSGASLFGACGWRRLWARRGFAGGVVLALAFAVGGLNRSRWPVGGGGAAAGVARADACGADAHGRALTAPQPDCVPATVFRAPGVWRMEGTCQRRSTLPGRWPVQ